MVNYYFLKSHINEILIGSSCLVGLAGYALYRWLNRPDRKASKTLAMHGYGTAAKKNDGTDYFIGPKVKSKKDKEGLTHIIITFNPTLGLTAEKMRVAAQHLETTYHTRFADGEVEGKKLNVYTFRVSTIKKQDG